MGTEAHLKTYDIWAEGYAVTGNRSGANFICKSSGVTFKDACQAAHRAGKFEGYGRYDPDHNSVWGCRLYDNEADARRVFG